ncbi:MAG: Uma2 family endonuclease [Solirubrobacteraceae bacterium]
MATAQRMTAQEYLEEQDRTVRSELVEGEVIVHDPRPTHQIVLRDLLTVMHAWTLAKPGRGGAFCPLDVPIDERNVFAPDLLWYADGRAPVRGDPWPSPLPDIAVEIRSPSTWRYDIGAKKAGYERVGLPELWLVDTAGVAIFVFRRSAPRSPTFDVVLELAAQDMLTSPLLPGFELTVGTLIEG